MDLDFPNINKVTTIEAISWYTGKVAEVTQKKHRIAGTFSEGYINALLAWKQGLNSKIAEARRSL
ncbi:hypothetical protein GKZ89_08890 [Bacillus mangrovi]|uniref:Uncharacterized protein n=1 Tax=Metabacillus mangrovi TaxID=1491830 RepID=A0A7X2V4Z9_9BACI|nr:hypothetical protein [Metabacillus mangrovi]MTH53533.1 hypothetical protein [Metabacillus mangrovi]